MRRPITILISTAAAVIPVSNIFFGTTPLARVAGASPVHAAARATASSHAIQGPSTNMRWGPVQVTIIVQGKRITDIKVTAPKERARSAIINNRAIPLLRREALQARTANVQLISGATMTSKAFVTSLHAAIVQAHL
jgi:uncharacterized protein with FMN-binding domain